ncbi:MAG TPA: exosortase [Candidatus Binatus sp.]|nr:exosortase [Candidatus Binatus sp.]
MSLSAVETLRETPTTRASASEWVRSHAWPLLIIVAAITLLYAKNFEKLFSDWSIDENYSHGFFVPLAFFWMLWRQRQELERTRVSPCSWGILIVLIALLQLAAGTWGAENFVAHSSLLVLLCGITLFLFGTEMLRLVAFPIAWLLFMIPLPSIIFYSITFPLQLLASKLAVGILDLLRVPNVCEGNVIYLANFTAGVAEACSGIRSLISMLAFAVLMGYLLDMSVRSRWILAITAVPIALGMNAARIAGTGLAGNYLGARWAEGFFHTFSGWLLFLVSLGLMLAAMHALRLFDQRKAAHGR